MSGQIHQNINLISGNPACGLLPGQPGQIPPKIRLLSKRLCKSVRLRIELITGHLKNRMIIAAKQTVIKCKHHMLPEIRGQVADAQFSMLMPRQQMLKRLHRRKQFTIGPVQIKQLLRIHFSIVRREQQGTKTAVSFCQRIRIRLGLTKSIHGS